MSYFRPEKARKTGPRSGSSLPDSTRNCLEKGVGSVQLIDNGQVYGNQGSVNSGIATFFTTNLPIGLHNMTAHYLGDANTQPSTSPMINQVVLGQTPLQITAASTSGIMHPVDFSVVVN